MLKQLDVPFRSWLGDAGEVEVLNAGVPNWTTFELLGVSTLWLSEIDPDLVILHVGVNDAFTAGYPDEGGPDNTAYRHAFSLPEPSAGR